jgi:putative ABC transport system permease protein
MVLAVRAAGDPLLAANDARNAIWSIDKDLAIAGLATMEQASGGFLSRFRFIALLAAVFAVAAFLLALVGVYGVISYSVNQRKHEFGIRMALGARTPNVLGLVMRQAFALTLTGVAIGVPAAVALAQALSSLLYGVSSTDPGTLVSAALVLGLAALAASYFPARRATRVDPMVALRCE